MSNLIVGRLIVASLWVAAGVSVGSNSCTDATGSRDRRILWYRSDSKGAAAEPYADSTLAVFTTFNDARVLALNARTGKLRWEAHLELPGGAPYAGMPFGGTLGAYADLIVVPAWDVYALDRATGDVRWTFRLTDDFPGYGSVFIAGSTVYSVGRRLYALNAADGTLRFQVDVGERPFRPIVVDDVIYVTTRREVLPGTLGNGHVMALDANTGATLWSTPIDDPQDSVRGGAVGPVAVRDTWVVVAGMNGKVYALDRSTGTVRWTYTGAGSYAAGLALVDEAVVVAGDAGKVEGVELSSGRRLWQTGPGSSVLEQITVGHGLALVSVGAVFAFDPQGQIRWQHGGAGYGGPVYSTAATYRDGVVYIGSVSPDGPGPGFYAVRGP
jgi:outer membrane protein assembly factor BamB